MDVKQKLKLAQIKKHKKFLSNKNTISLNEIIGSEKCQKIISECRDFRDRIYMVRKEIGIHFLAYNFIRIMIAEACAKHNAIPNQVSFKGTVQLLNNFMPHFIHSNSKKNKMMYAELLKKIVKNKIGNRPGRVEPRRVKRRPKPFDTLNRPRFIEKAKLLKFIRI